MVTKELRKEELIKDYDELRCKYPTQMFVAFIHQSPKREVVIQIEIISIEDKNKELIEALLNFDTKWCFPSIEIVLNTYVALRLEPKFLIRSAEKGDAFIDEHLRLKNFKSIKP